jgi:hypothetical protein
MRRCERRPKRPPQLLHLGSIVVQLLLALRHEARVDQYGRLAHLIAIMVLHRGPVVLTLLFAVIGMAVARHRCLVIQILAPQPPLLARP